MVEIDGKSVKYGDHIKGYVPRAEHDGFKNKFLGDLRTQLGTLAARMRQQPQGQGQRRTGAQNIQEVLSQVGDMPIVDGKTLKMLADNGLTPLAQAVDSQQKMLTELVNHVRQLKGGVGAVHQRHSQQDFDGMVGEAIASIEGVDANDEFVRELAQDVYHSHEDWKPQTQKAEFSALLKKRYDQAVAHVRRMDKALVEKKRNTPVTFTRPGGDGNPGGAPRNGKPLTAKEVTQRVFGGQAGART